MNCCSANMMHCFFFNVGKCIHPNPKIINGLGIKLCGSYTKKEKQGCLAGNTKCFYLSEGECHHKNPRLDVIINDVGLGVKTLCGSFIEGPIHITPASIEQYYAFLKGENTMNMKEINEIKNDLQHEALFDFYDTFGKASKAIKKQFKSSHLYSRAAEAIAYLQEQIDLQTKQKEEARLLWPGQIFALDKVEYISDRVDVLDSGKEVVVTCIRHEDWKRENFHLFLNNHYSINDLDDVLRQNGYKIVPDNTSPFSESK